MVKADLSIYLFPHDQRSGPGRVACAWADLLDRSRLMFGAVRAPALFCLLAILLLLPGLAGASEAGKRVALVVGNGAYTEVNALPNARGDAEALAKKLQSIGFDVTLAVDVDAAGFRKALQDVEAKASGADIAAVYYAGHGMEIDGVNYLIPIDAKLTRDTHVQDEAIALPRVISAIDGAKMLRLVLLDACRDNPFLRKMERGNATRAVSRGLARVEPNGSTLVAFAAEAGAVASDGGGAHSPYATALLDTLGEPGLELNFVFRRVAARVRQSTDQTQSPVIYGSLGEEEIYLVPKTPEPVIAKIEPKIEPKIEKVEPKTPAGAWQDTLNAGTETAVIAFMKEFNDEFYRSLAVERLDNLRAAATRRDIATASLDDVYWLTIRNSVNPEDFRAYLRRQPTGPNADLAQARIEMLERASEINKELGTRSATALDIGGAIQRRATSLPVNVIQYGLDALGFPPDKISGVLDPSTKRAIRAYQASANVPQTGKLAPQQVIDVVVAAAAIGETHAQTTIGVMLATGDIWPKDYMLARAWLQHAANKENPAAMVNLAIFYRDGLGVDKDVPEARRLLGKAKKLGSSDADTVLATLVSPT